MKDLSAQSAQPSDSHSESHDSDEEFGNEWPGQLPDEWQLVKLKALATLHGQKSASTSDCGTEKATGVCYVTPSELGDFQAKRNTELYLPAELASKFDVVPAQSVALCTIASVGETALFSTEFVTNPQVRGLVPRDHVRSRFLFYVLAASKQELERLSSVSVVPFINGATLKNVLVPLPPLEKQHEIVRFLDEKLRYVGKLIAKKERLIELLEERRTALITKAVTKGLDPDVPMKDSGVEWLGEIPEHWDFTSLTNLSPNITVGIVVKPTEYYEPDGVPCLRSQNVKLADISYDNLVYIGDHANEQLDKSQIFAGDLVAVRTGDPGTTAVVPPSLDGANCIDLIIVRQPRAADEKWLCWFMNSSVAQVQYRIWSGGAAQQHLNVGAVKRLRVPVPPVDEQKAIAEHIQNHERRFRRLRMRIEEAMDHLNEYRSALITAAVTGKIDVRDHAA